MTEQPYLRRPLKPGFGQVDITPSLNYKSITGKFISSDVIFIDIGCNQHLSHPTDHGGRPGDIVNRPLQIIQILGQHFSVYSRGLAVPRFLRARRVGHCGNKRELWVCLLQILQDFQEGRVLGPPIGIKEVQLVGRVVVVGLPYDAGKRCDSDSTGKEYGRLSGILMQCERAYWRSIFTAVPSGIFFSDRLNAVSRMRVANISWSSNGALAMEKVRTFAFRSRFLTDLAMSGQRIVRV